MLRTHYSADDLVVMAFFPIPLSMPSYKILFANKVISALMLFKFFLRIISIIPQSTLSKSHSIVYGHVVSWWYFIISNFSSPRIYSQNWDFAPIRWKLRWPCYRIKTILKLILKNNIKSLELLPDACIAAWFTGSC